jgi:hypothetical protein
MHDEHVTLDKLLSDMQQMLYDPDQTQSDAAAGDPKRWVDQLFSATTEE